MSPIRLSKFENAIRLILSYHQALNRRDVAGMMQFVSEDCVFEQSRPAPDGSRCAGKQAVALYWEDFFHQRPYARFDIEEIFSLGERCVMRWSLAGTEQASGPERLRGVDIFRVTSGTIREIFSYVKG